VYSCFGQFFHTFFSPALPPSSRAAYLCATPNVGSWQLAGFKNPVIPSAARNLPRRSDGKTKKTLAPPDRSGHCSQFVWDRKIGWRTAARKSQPLSAARPFFGRAESTGPAAVYLTVVVRFDGLAGGCG